MNTVFIDFNSNNMKKSIGIYILYNYCYILQHISKVYVSYTYLGNVIK